MTNKLKQDLGLLQGVGLLATSLLGTGVFAVPAIIAQIAGYDGLWAWPLLLILVFPIAIVFASLGKHYPSAGGVAYFIAKAFNPVLGRVTGWAFLSVIPVGVPAALYISSGFWQSLFNFSPMGEFAIQIITLLLICLLGLFSAGASGWIQAAIAILIIGLVGVICLTSSPSVLTIQWPAITAVQPIPIIKALAIMFWCFVGLEAFVHLTSEFKNSARDFPRSLIIGLLIAGFVYWACTAAVIFFNPQGVTGTTALPKIVEVLLGHQALWIFCIIGYLACFASINIYSQSFARLIWAQASVDNPNHKLAKLNKHHAPANALIVVVLLSSFFLLLAQLFTIPLESLLEYANGVFVLIYLLAMISAIKLLKGKIRIFAYISTVICVGLLIVIGLKSLYAIGIFIILWIIAKRRERNVSTHRH